MTDPETTLWQRIKHLLWVIFLSPQPPMAERAYWKYMEDKCGMAIYLFMDNPEEMEKPNWMANMAGEVFKAMYAASKP